MKLKRFITVFMMITVLAGCSITVYAYSVGEGRVEDRYQLPGKAQLVASAYITEAGWGKNETGCSAAIVGDERDAAGSYEYEFFYNYEPYDWGLLGLDENQYSHSSTYKANCDRGSSSIRKKGTDTDICEARSYVNLYE